MAQGQSHPEGTPDPSEPASSPVLPRGLTAEGQVEYKAKAQLVVGYVQEELDNLPSPGGVRGVREVRTAWETAIGRLSREIADRSDQKASKSVSARVRAASLPALGAVGGSAAVALQSAGQSWAAAGACLLVILLIVFLVFVKGE